MEIEELLALETAGIQALRAIRYKHLDADTQRLVADALEHCAERVIMLNRLYHYREGKEEGTNGKEAHE
jgi:hypothetical protein